MVRRSAGQERLPKSDQVEVLNDDFDGPGVCRPPCPRSTARPSFPADGLVSCVLHLQLTPFSPAACASKRGPAQSSLTAAARPSSVDPHARRLASPSVMRRVGFNPDLPRRGCHSGGWGRSDGGERRGSGQRGKTTFERGRRTQAACWWCSQLPGTSFVVQKRTAIRIGSGRGQNLDTAGCCSLLLLLLLVARPAA